jgi:MerR family transcriptional regulator, thiopeptide resistance regulator
MKYQNEKLWRTKEFAHLAKVTVRTLQYYDRCGLLKPHRRTAKGFRLYGTEEFARLQQISTLKFIGFSLAQIKEILAGQNFALTETLRLQRAVLEAQAKQINLALAAIEKAEKLQKESGTIDWESFHKIREVIDMETNTEWTRKYYSESAQAKIEKLKEKWSPELQERVSNDWKKLYYDVEAAIAEGENPQSERSQKLVLRWNDLISQFTGGDAEIREGLNKMYADENNWEGNFQTEINSAVRDFISEAMKR